MVAGPFLIFPSFFYNNFHKNFLQQLFTTTWFALVSIHWELGDC